MNAMIQNINIVIKEKDVKKFIIAIVSLILLKMMGEIGVVPDIFVMLVVAAI